MLALKYKSILGAFLPGSRNLWTVSGTTIRKYHSLLGPQHFSIVQKTSRSSSKISNLRCLVTRTSTNNFNDISGDKPTSPHTIYFGVLTNQLRTVKKISLMTSAMGLLLQPQIIMNQAEHSVVVTAAALIGVGIFTYITPFMIHFLCKRYVTEIIFDPMTDKYTAVTYNFFLKRREIQFTPDDVIVPDVPGPFTTIHVKSSSSKKAIPLFVTQNMFSHPEHYGRMMKFDKPIDLHMSSLNSQQKETSDRKKTSSMSR